MAETHDRLDDAVNHYLEAIKQGDNDPALARHAVGLLYRTQRAGQIDTLLQTLSSRGVEMEDPRLASAVRCTCQA